MGFRLLDAKTVVDVAVNLIPLSIIAFFVVLFAAFNPWGVDPLRSSIQFAILLSMIVGLAIVTYYAARAMAGGPEEGVDR